MRKTVYASHSRNFDSKKELYEPLRQSELNEKYRIILPHEENERPFNSKYLLMNDCELMIAEISYPSSGVGIEIGWADAFGVPIILAHKKNIKMSGSLSRIVSFKLEYENTNDLIQKLEEVFKKRHF